GGRALSYLYNAGSDDALSRVSELNDGAALVRYTYLGLGSFVKGDYPQPGVRWDLSASSCGGSSSSSGSRSGSSSSSSVSGTAKYPGLDQFGRVINNLWCKYTGASGAVDQIRYGYDRVSNRIWRRNVVAATGQDELYRYDGAQRLEDFNRGTLNAQANNISSLTLKQEWELDATGNWDRFEQFNPSDASQALDQERTANAFNEITGISATVGPVWVTPQYDRNGNMTVMPNGDAPTQSFQNTWDAWNRLVKVMSGVSTISQYAYDGQNWRTTKTVAGTVRHYYYTSGWQVLEERLDAATTAERQFVWGLRYIDDQVVRDRAPSGSGTLTERLYALQDANWNMDAIVNASGSVQERYSYTAYGVPTVLTPGFTTRAASSFDWETRYAGYRWEDEVSAYLVRWRWLQAGLGRWLSTDHLSPYYDGMNPTRYVRNRPITSVDPHGESTYSEEMEELRRRFLDWYQHESEDGDKTWLIGLPNCPCKLTLTKEGPCNPNPSVWNNPSEWTFGFHPGAKWCTRSKGWNWVGAAQQCCYDATGNLITHGPGAGTPDKVSIDWSNFPLGGSGSDHQAIDVEPARWAQALDGYYANQSGLYTYLYNLMRPPNNGNRCRDNPPVPDPTIFELPSPDFPPI
ncbi:MAG: RHS repeat-associated core domain-containing protein, partial [Planctomycetaceae bacterium]|nr:RHS repeat-associated core domain-containing protein [Planctomycetaceae bacterium]